MSKKVLAFDFGASSGRAVLFHVIGGKLEMQEVHRFSNDPVEINGTLHWDVLRLYHEIKVGITKAKAISAFDAIGIDTWGVDFGLIDENGNLLENPVHYRDERTDGCMEKVFKLIPKKELYLRCGLQFMRFNTLFQLFYLQNNRNDLMSRTKKLLLMPDLFAYFLTGEMRSEFSLASTTQMLNPKTDEWDLELLKELGINSNILPPLIHAGETYGKLSQKLADELGVPRIPVIAVCAHDTASAVVAVPEDKEQILFLSCGTWSLIGTELHKPILTEKSYECDMTNERGYNKTTRLLKNIMGLWIIQECRRQWEREGIEISFAEIAKQANESEPFANYIDVDASIFEMPGNMPDRIVKYCADHGQTPPHTIGEIARCVYESLADKYRKSYQEIESVTGKKFNVLNIVGGGCNAEILCQFTANALNMTVCAGPSEGTATGNALVQLMALGEVDNISEARKIVKNSTDIKVYKPSGVWLHK